MKGVCRWQPDRDAKAVIQILHGLGEYVARYERFANDAVAAGFAVVAHDLRGHGEGCSPENLGHFADHNGWDKVVDDVLLVQQEIAGRFPGLPVVLLGHSMGSYIAQSFVMRHPENVSMLILSASTYADRAELTMGHMLARLLAYFGKRRKSKLLNQLGFGNFNKRFRPNRTEYDWISRDEAEVDKYVADPLCGGQFSNQLWRDLTGGLLEITSEDAIGRIPTDLPILIIGGQADPVGGEKKLTKLADVYRQTGHVDVTLEVYDGGRHEMLNETNRDEVTRDILNWTRSRL